MYKTTVYVSLKRCSAGSNNCKGFFGSHWDQKIPFRYNRNHVMGSFHGCTKDDIHKSKLAWSPCSFW